MTLAGAMAEDLETLEKGLISVPPPDQHGRGVIYWHRTRMILTVASRCSTVSYPPDPMLLRNRFLDTPCSPLPLLVVSPPIAASNCLLCAAHCNHGM
jgi:hypothetical protein